MKRIIFIIILSGIFIGISADPVTLPQKEGHVFSDGFEEEDSYEYWQRYIGYEFDVRLLQ